MQSQNYRQSVTLFSGKWEIFSLAWPALVLLLCAHLYFSNLGASKNMENAIQFIAGFVFLNVIHAILSIFIIAYFPEARAWRKSYEPKQRHRLYLKWAALLICLLATFYYILSLRDKMPWPYLLIWTFATKLVSTYHHTLAQMRGFSSAYNFTVSKCFSLSEAEVEEHRRRDKWENYLFKAMFAVAAVDLWFRLHPETSYRLVFPIIMLLIFAAILFNSSQFPFAGQSTKTLYLCRLIFYPLGALDLRFLLGIQFIHGIEHSMLFFKMWRKSEIRNERGRVFIWCFLVPIAVLFGLISIFRTTRGFGLEFLSAYPNYSVLVITLATISIGLNYFHFYLDREIFRMRDKRVRENIGPLIIGESKAG